MMYYDCLVKLFRPPPPPHHVYSSQLPKLNSYKSVVCDKDTNILLVLVGLQAP